ncbi:MAG: hypothetical protein JWQ28_3234 [Pedobacter sp.]|jgi:hypothetical protein|nr:hypothetical protein [Pedobacter sp.]
MEILQYIAELVQSQREIGITGLGTIYKKKSPGRYEAATQSFLPPSYTIAFKEEITDQETFGTHLALAENISKESANAAIEQFVDGIKLQLSEYGRANFAPLGTLRTDNGNLHLDVQEDFSAGLEFFGLPRLQNEPSKPENEELNEPEPINQVEEVNSSVELPEPVEAEPLTVAPETNETEAAELEIIEPTDIDFEVEEPVSFEPEGQAPELIEETITEVPENLEEQETVDDTVAPVVKVDPVEENIIIDNLLEEENPGNETHEPQLIEVQKAPLENSIKYTIHEQPAAKKSDTLMLKVVLSLLALVILGIIAYFLYPRTTELEKEPAVVAVDSTKIRADSLQRAIQAGVVQDSIARQDSLAKANPAASQTILPDSSKLIAADTTTTFEIIGASVLNQKEADWFITQMRRNGIKAKVVRNIPGKRLKMSIATLHDEKAAKMERDRLEKKLEIKGIYIYRNKKD